MVLALELHAVDLRVATVDRRRARLSGIAARELRTAEQHHLDVLVLVVERRDVDAQRAVEPVGLGADLEGGERLGIEGLDLRADERAGVRAAALETRRYAGVGHELLASSGSRD